MHKHTIFSSVSGLSLALLVGGLFSSRAMAAVAGASPLPAASAYVATPVESVHGGLVYGISVQPQTSEVYVASETMRGEYFGNTHDPANGTWKSSDMGKSWHRIGPGGANVKVSKTDPKVVYANDRYGLYKTTDGGANWTTILPKEKKIGYKGLDVFAKDHNIIYAGGPGWLYVSRDGGKTWAENKLPVQKDVTVRKAAPRGQSKSGSDAPKTTTEDKPARIQVIQIHPENPDIAFLAFYDGGFGGVWKTSDGGKTFEQLTGANARGMALSPSNPNVIYCSGGVSHDGGKTWATISASAWCITVHPTNSEVAFYSNPGGPVRVTTNGGRHFVQLLGVESNYDGTEVEGLAVDAKHDIIWAGGDMIWQGANASTGKVRLVRSDDGYHDISFSDIQSTPTGVWACSDAQGMHFTRDGKTWTTTAMGMHGTDALHRVAPSPTDPLVGYAGHETRLFKTVDGGKTWFNIFSQWFPYCLIDPVDVNCVYMSSNSGNGDMIRSTDGGMNFKQLGKGRFLMIHPKEPQTIYAELPDGLYVSRNRGDQFEKICSDSNLGDFFISRTNPSMMFSARRDPVEKGAPKTLSSAVLHRSTDGGKTWQKLPQQLQGPCRFAQSADGALWLADPKTGLIRSKDDGMTWERVFDGMGTAAADPWDSHSLYMISKGTIFWIHPKDVTRAEIPAPKIDDSVIATIEMAEPLYLDRSNVVIKITKDIELFGHARSLLMMARGLKNITLDGQGHKITASGAPVIFADDVENVTIKNVKFIGGSGSNRERAILYITNARGLMITNCTFEGEGKTAICTRGVFTSGVTVEDCVFTTAGKKGGACIDGNGRHTIRRCTMDGSSAIELSLADGSVIEKNTIASGGVSLAFLQQARVADNIMGNAGKSVSIELQDANRCVVSGNKVSLTISAKGSAAAVLSLTNANGNAIEKNTFHVDGGTGSQGGRMESSSGNTLTNNRFEVDLGVAGKKACGLSMSNCKNNTLTGNTITASGTEAVGLLLQNSADNKIAPDNKITPDPKTAPAAMPASGVKPPPAKKAASKKKVFTTMATPALRDVATSKATVPKPIG